jgi:hypothetical protein
VFLCYNFCAMRFAIIVSFMCLTVNAAQVPRGSSEQANSKANGRREAQALIVLVNDYSTRKQAQQSDSSAPEGGASVWANVPNWLLVLVGIGTFVAVWRQAIETKRAAEAANVSSAAAKTSADAAQSSANALINIERAWLVLMQIGPSEILVKIQVNMGTPIDVHADFVNHGNTPAWIIRESCIAEVRDNILPCPTAYLQEYTTAYSSGEKPIPPQGQHKVSAKLFIGLSSNAGADLITDLAGTQKRVYFYGFVEYRDVFGEVRNCRFRFIVKTWYEPNMEYPNLKPRFVARWVTDGEEGDNRCT